MLRPRVLVPLLGVLTVGVALVAQRACSSGAEVRIAAPGRPELRVPVPAFSLLDQEGRTFGADALRGSVWITSFVFTRCPAICPRSMERMKALEQSTRDLGGRLRFLAISVDPDNDDPPAMKAYGERFGVDPARWTLLTGDEKQIQDTVLRGFKLALTKDERGDIVHSERFALLDGEGTIRGYFDSDDAGRRALEEAARRLVDAL